MKVIGYGVTDTGPQREKNDDVFLADNELGLYIVCDGVGGTAGGHIASDIACQTVHTFVTNNIQGKSLAVTEVEDLLKRAVQLACHAVYEKAQSSPQYSKMGTTLSMLLLHGTAGFIAHVGDSSVFLKRGKAVHKLTRDHTFVSEMVRCGEMSREDAVDSPFSHVLTRWIGQGEALQVDTLFFEVLPEDRFLICSDGLDSVYSDTRLLLEQLARENPAAIPAELVALANKRDGSDNATAIFLAVEEEGVADSQEAARVRTVNLSISTLERMYVFKDVSLKDLMLIIERSSVYHCDAKQVLIREGEESDTLFVLLEGSVRILRSGHELATLQQGSHFGEMALLNKEPRSATVISQEPSTFLLIDQNSFFEVVKNRPEVGSRLLLNIAQELSRRLQQSNEQQYGDVKFTM